MKLHCKDAELFSLKSGFRSEMGNGFRAKSYKVQIASAIFSFRKKMSWTYSMHLKSTSSPQLDCFNQFSIKQCTNAPYVCVDVR